MENLTMNVRNDWRWDSRLFLIAGGFMLINTALLWVRLYSDYQLSILWPAIPAIAGLACGALGLLKLYPRASVDAPKLAKVGAGFALLASIALGVATLWILGLFVFGEGMPQPAPQGLLLLIVIFMVAVVLAFFSNATACLLHAAQRKIGYLLTVPVAVWSIMLVAGIFKGMEVALSLDFYTNAVIGAAFLALGFTLKTSRNVDA